MRVASKNVIAVSIFLSVVTCGCQEKFDLQRSVVWKGNEVKIQLLDVAVHQVKGDSYYFLFGNVNFPSLGSAQNIADLNCLILKVGSKTSEQTYVDSRASHLSNMYELDENDPTVPVYWTFNKKDSSLNEEIDIFLKDGCVLLRSKADL